MTSIIKQHIFEIGRRCETKIGAGTERSSLMTSWPGNQNIPAYIRNTATNEKYTLNGCLSSFPRGLLLVLFFVMNADMLQLNLFRLHYSIKTLSTLKRDNLVLRRCIKRMSTVRTII